MKFIYSLVAFLMIAGIKTYAQNNFASTGDATLNTSKPASHGGGYYAL